MDIITAILEIDRHAKQRIQKAYEEQNRILHDASAEKVAIHDKIMTRAKSRIEKVETFENESAEKKIKAIIANQEQTIAELDNIYNSNHENWENELYNAIIG